MRVGQAVRMAVQVASAERALFQVAVEAEAQEPLQPRAAQEALLRLELVREVVPWQGSEAPVVVRRAHLAAVAVAELELSVEMEAMGGILRAAPAGELERVA